MSLDWIVKVNYIDSYWFSTEAISRLKGLTDAKLIKDWNSQDLPGVDDGDIKKILGLPALERFIKTGFLPVGPKRPDGQQAEIRWGDEEAGIEDAQKVISEKLKTCGIRVRST
jgi:hypothetical protein